MEAFSKAVSYTHLDVYKRQVHRFAKQADGSYKSPAGVFITLAQREDGKYTAHRSDDIDYLFNESMMIEAFSEDVYKRQVYIRPVRTLPLPTVTPEATPEPSLTPEAVPSLQPVSYTHLRQW